MLSAAAEEEEIKLMKNYPEGQGIPLIKKLYNLIDGVKLIDDVKYKTKNKSIAIFVSSFSERLYYFDYSDKEMTNYR